MKRILFPATNRVHKARQQLLLDELKKDFQVDVLEYESPHKDMLNVVADIANHYRPAMDYYDLVLVRGDRFEMLPVAMLAAYRGLKIAHLEGGDLSGAIDNKVRYAITALADLHFSTNKESFSRLISMGTDPDWTFNFGSLDVEYARFQFEHAKTLTHRPTGQKLKVPVFVPPKRKKQIVLCHHPMPGENAEVIESIIKEFSDYELVIIKTNSDNGKAYGTEEFTPEEYIRLVAESSLLVGNSSSFLKEASVFGTPVVNIGDRQKNRLKSSNVVDVPFKEKEISDAIARQLTKQYTPSEIYYKPETSKRICQKIKEYLA